MNRQKKEVEKKRQLELLAITPIDSFSGSMRFLSNFFLVDIEWGGLSFTSTEAAYQAAKTTDHELRKKFVPLGPSEAKRLGNEIELRPGWDEVRDTVMWELVAQKFSKEPLRQLLQKTKPRALVEGNHWHDVYWGVCNGKCKYGPHPSYGENHLGLTLMEVRDVLV